MERNESIRANVRIYGQEYSITGDKSKEEIEQIASHVDEVMKQIGRTFTLNSQGSIAVLSAVNISEELLEANKELERLREENERLQSDVEHYIKMWDEAKNNFTQYKENALKAKEQREESSRQVDELQAKCNELETLFFDLQMENVQLKNELEKYRGSDE